MLLLVSLCVRVYNDELARGKKSGSFYFLQKCVANQHVRSSTWASALCHMQQRLSTQQSLVMNVHKQSHESEHFRVRALQSHHGSDKSLVFAMHLRYLLITSFSLWILSLSTFVLTPFMIFLALVMASNSISSTHI